MNIRDATLSAIKNASAMMRKQARLAHAYRSMWEMPEGRLVFNDLLQKAGLLVTHEAPCDPDTRSFEAGQRAFGVHILQRLRWSEGEMVALARQQTSDALDNLEEEG